MNDKYRQTRNTRELKWAQVPISFIKNTIPVGLWLFPSGLAYDESMAKKVIKRQRSSHETAWLNEHDEVVAKVDTIDIILFRRNFKSCVMDVSWLSRILDSNPDKLCMNIFHLVFISSLS